MDQLEALTCKLDLSTRIIEQNVCLLARNVEITDKTNVVENAWEIFIILELFFFFSKTLHTLPCVLEVQVMYKMLISKHTCFCNLFFIFQGKHVFARRATFTLSAPITILEFLDAANVFFSQLTVLVSKAGVCQGKQGPPLKWRM